MEEFKTIEAFERGLKNLQVEALRVKRTNRKYPCIKCVNTGSAVIALPMDMSYLNVTLPSLIVAKKLIYLDLSGNMITSSYFTFFMNHIDELPNLKSIDISNNTSITQQSVISLIEKTPKMKSCDRIFHNTKVTN